MSAPIIKSYITTRCGPRLGSPAMSSSSARERSREAKVRRCALSISESCSRRFRIRAVAFLQGERRYDET